MTMPDNRSLSELFADAIAQFKKLVRDELHLARAEFSSKATQAINGISLLVGAAIFLIPTVALIMLGVAALLEESGMKASTANFLVGAAGLVIVLVLALAGKSRLKARTLVPDRTLAQLQQDAVAAKEHV